jgi:pyruvate carboxylase subunit B
MDDKGYGKMVLGYFGKTPVAPDPELVKWASEQLGLEPTTEAVVDINDRNPKLGVKYNTELLEAAGLPVTEENIFIAAACGDKGINFLKGDKPFGIRYKEEAPAKSGKDSGVYTATVDGKAVTVEMAADGKSYTAKVGGKSFKVEVAEGASAAAAAAPAAAGEGKAVVAPLPGTVTKVLVAEGDSVAAGDVLLILEAVKMENEIKADCDGVVKSINVSTGATVQAGDALVTIG